MSATNFYLEKGFTPMFKSVVVNESTTIAAWTPTTSTRIVITGLQVAANLASTFAFYFGNLAGTRIFQGASTGSATVFAPNIYFECPTYDRVVYFVGKPGSTDGFIVNLQGFEIS